MKRTKIVCTIGPASETKTKIEKMIKAGLNVARLNFSHGSYKHHAMLINNIRNVSEKLGQPVAILQDLQGPRIRIGDVAKEGISVGVGEILSLVPENFKVSLKNVSTFIPIQYPNLYRDVKKGTPILIDDAKIELEVLEVKNRAIRCKVKVGDVINAHKGMNFPKSHISAPAITLKDKEDLAFGIKQDVDFIALSFVKDASDILDLRKLISNLETKVGRKSTDFRKPNRGVGGPKTFTKIIAKIERPEAVAHFEEILSVTDGVMVARGDLGLEIPLEDLPLIQKRIVRRCVKESKPVIVATQMLDSMIRYPTPTRAEVSDVANAILDGTDAIMLSGETATGKYPLKAVQVMARIAHEVEKTEIKEHQEISESLKSVGGVTETVSFAVQKIAHEVKAKLIVCATTSGFTARSIVKYRPHLSVVALAATEKTRNQLCLSWGVSPYYLSFNQSFNQLINEIKKLLIHKELVEKGDVVVIAAGHPFGYLGQTNLIKVETI